MTAIEEILKRQIEDTAKRAGEIHLSASKHALNDLLNEILSEEYTTIEQVKLSIKSTLCILDMLGEK